MAVPVNFGYVDNLISHNRIDNFTKSMIEGTLDINEILISCFYLKEKVAEAHRMLSSTHSEAALSEIT